MSRAKFTYTLPKGISSQVGITSVTLVELTAGEELMATKRAGNDPIRLAWELPKEALRAVDGKALNAADDSLDKMWEEMHPKVRAFVMRAYNQLHSPEDQDVEGFLKSRQTEV